MGVERDSKTGDLTHVYGDQGNRGLSGDDEIAAGFYGKVEGPPEPIRDHGKIVTAPAGTSEEDIRDKLTGADKLPPIGQELGRAPKAPPFDPHEGREVDPGREFGGEPEPMISTLVFMGVDQGGDFEDSIQQVVAAAKDLGLIYVTATVGALDLDKHVGDVADLAEATLSDYQDDDEPEDKPDDKLDEEPL
jgi:hypothetical protein